MIWRKGMVAIVMKICALKMLYHLLRTGKVDRINTCAIIVANETPLRPEILGKMQYCYIPFADAVYGANLMTNQMANEIVDYFARIPETCQKLYICCDAGESRSAAIAAAFLRCSGEDDIRHIWRKAKYHPNIHVYRTMCRALGVRITDEELSLLIKLNDETLESAICSAREKGSDDKK